MKRSPDHLRMPRLVSFVVGTSLSVWVWLTAWCLALFFFPSRALGPTVGLAAALIVALYVGFWNSYVSVSDEAVEVRNLFHTRRISLEDIEKMDRVHLMPIVGQVDAYFLRLSHKRRWRRFVLLLATSRFEGKTARDAGEWLDRTPLSRYSVTVPRKVAR